MSNPAGMIPAPLGSGRPPTPPCRATPRASRALCAGLSALLSLGWPHGTQAQAIPGIDEWAAATVESGQAKWVGQRVPFPDPSPRPVAERTLRSVEWPLSVHVTQGRSLERAQATLRALEAAYTVFAATGFTHSFGDGGQGGTGDHDVYLVDGLAGGVDARLDATLPVSGLDAARAFALIDERVPMALVEACAAQALAEVLFFELDPAEAASVRKSSAAYLAFLATGTLGCSDDAERAGEAPYRAAMDTTPTAHGARWLSLLAGREDGHTGIFLREMWQFARQLSWEGAGLRGSPDLFEAMATAKALRKDTFEEVAAELSILSLLQLGQGPIGHDDTDPRHGLLLADVAWSALPEHVAPAFPPIEPLGSAYVLVRTQGALPGERLRVWSRGELGVRWTVTAAQLAADGRSLSRVVIPTRDNPDGFLVVELESGCTSVLIAATNVSDGIPDADSTRGDDLRSIAFILDRGRD